MVDKIKMLIRAWHYRLRENPNEIAFILANAKPGDTLFDIGANKGGFLNWMVHKAGINGHVTAFEPQQFLYLFLRKYFSRTRFPQVNIEPYALSDKDEYATMIIPNSNRPSSPGASIHFSPKDNPGARAVQVQTISLNTYCTSNHLTPNLIKIDVEGHELKVIQGGLKTLRDCKPKIILECEALQVGRSVVKETFDTILSLGYSGYFFYKGNKIDIQDFLPEKHQPETFIGKKSREYCSNFFFV
jgi:FkbM family methyltransferase